MRNILPTLRSGHSPLPARFFRMGLAALCVYLLASCAQATMAPAPTQEVIVQTQVVEKTVVVTVAGETKVVTITPAPPASPSPAGAVATALPAPTNAPTQALPTPAPSGEPHQVELEWPPRLRLGESDVIRLALVPSKDGYTVTTEFPEHQTQTQQVYVPRPGGYDLYAVARLDGVGFELSPQGEQPLLLLPGETVTWRWSVQPRQAGRQRLTVSLALRWTPTGAGQSDRTAIRQVSVFSRSLNVEVLAFFGLSQGQAAAAGFFSLLLGGGLGLLALILRPPARQPIPALQAAAPNPDVQIELHPGLQLQPPERRLLQALFGRYARLVIEGEFLSGYSGARTFLALPIRPDGRADAYTIAKLGERQAIQQEFKNYETFVKDTLPPVTARIQRPPVVLGRSAPPEAGPELAALQYTFIGQPGRQPTSLRSALLASPDPALLQQLFDTFGPHWWMQRKPYTFQLAREYDVMLPSHLALTPASGSGRSLDGRTAPGELQAASGELLTLHHFSVERRADGQSLNLIGSPAAGQPPLRLRWLAPELPHGAEMLTGRVVSTRQTFLEECAQACRRRLAAAEVEDLPDPLLRLPGLLAETVTGSQSTIHGDLNLENALVGPGNMIWLIDFARTRDGHPLFDFAHLQAEIIAQILASQLSGPLVYRRLLEGDRTACPEQAALIETLQALADRCLFNPNHRREYDLALYAACLGALKFTNVNETGRDFLYLTAAHLSARL